MKIATRPSVSAGLTRPWWARPASVAALALADVVGLVLAVALAYEVWARPVLGQATWVYLEILPLLPLVLLAFAEGGLYPGFGLGAVETLRRLSLRVSFVYVMLAAITWVIKLPHRHSRVTFAIAWGASLVVVPLLRVVVLALVRRTRWWGEPTVLIGSGEIARETVTSLGGALSLGYRPAAVLRLPGEDRVDFVAGVPVVGEVADAPRLARAGVRTVLVATGGEGGEDLDFSRLGEVFRHVVLVRDFAALPVEGVEIRNLGGVLGVEFTHQLMRRRNRALKRALDLVLGGLGAIVTLPVIAVAALAIKLVNRGPAFFTQQREGLFGEPIRVRKLRTMHSDAEQRLASHLAADPAARAEWEQRFKLARDPRVIGRVGQVLRRFSIDELPQLWNVISGEMSLVGPRPFPEYHLASFDSAFRRLRSQVRPGLTGLWQVTTRSDGDLAAQQGQDTYYIRNWSLWMDLYVLARTVSTVLTGRGAY